jgi:hypothetical protein
MFGRAQDETMYHIPITRSRLPKELPTLAAAIKDEIDSQPQNDLLQ